MLKKSHHPSGQKNEISPEPFDKAFQQCEYRANQTSNGEVMVKTMDRGCSPLKSFPTM
ncbi:hypothetical protein OROMI_034976 [Orobanche minor]